MISHSMREEQATSLEMVAQLGEPELTDRLQAIYDEQYSRDVRVWFDRSIQLGANLPKGSEVVQNMCHTAETHATARIDTSYWDVLHTNLEGAQRRLKSDDAAFAVERILSAVAGNHYSIGDLDTALANHFRGSYGLRQEYRGDPPKERVVEYDDPEKSAEYAAQLVEIGEIFDNPEIRTEFDRAGKAPIVIRPMYHIVMDATNKSIPLPQIVQALKGFENYHSLSCHLLSHWVYENWDKVHHLPAVSASFGDSMEDIILGEGVELCGELIKRCDVDQLKTLETNLQTLFKRVGDYDTTVAILGAYGSKPEVLVDMMERVIGPEEDSVKSYKKGEKAIKRAQSPLHRAWNLHIRPVFS